MAQHCWGLLKCSRSQINLDKLLACGQSFRWKRNGLGEWLGVMGNLVWRLRQTEEGIQYQIYGNDKDDKTELADLTSDKSSIMKNCSDAQKMCENASDLNFAQSSAGIQRRSSKRKVSCVELKSKPQNHVKNLKKGPIRCLQMKEEMTNDTMATSGRLQECESLPGIIKTLRHEDDLKPSLTSKDKKILDVINKDERHISLLGNYFQLGVDLEKLYMDWSTSDPHFSKVAKSFQGIRILRQDPTENLLSFVCSSNNHISRIASMVEKLCRHYGQLIAEVDGESFFSVPSFSALIGDDVESHLRQLGFGYRAKFIPSIAKFIMEQKYEGWLESLRHQTYEVAKKELLNLMGVGHKVADCVCLMSLDKHEAVPVDTHVWQITATHYMPKLKITKTLTNKIYYEIEERSMIPIFTLPSSGDFYRGLWGPYAGWAHSVLFTADLKQNKTDIPQKAASPKKKSKKS